jgi:hypothetical protein
LVVFHGPKKFDSLIIYFLEILKELTPKEKENERLVKFLTVIAKKAKSGKIFIINPLDKSKLLEILDSVTDSDGIPYPKYVF